MNPPFFVLSDAPSLIGLVALGICWAATRRLAWFWITAWACCGLFLLNDVLAERWTSPQKNYGPHGAGVSVPPPYAIVIWAGLMLLRHVIEFYRCWKQKPQRFFAIVVSFVAFLLIFGAMWFVGIPVR